MIIRMAQIGDIKSLLPLLSQLGYATTLPDLTSRFQSFIDQPGYGVVVAADKDHIAGFIAWSRVMLFVSDKIRFHIEALIIDAAYRRHGLGKRLIAHLENYAQQYPHVVIDLTSNIKRAADGAHDFYKSLGYVNEGNTQKIYLRREFYHDPSNK